MTNVSFNELYPLIEEQLAKNGEIRFKPRGTSMLPLLRQGKDEVVVSKFDGELHKYDILFYRRADGDFILHRLIGFDKDKNPVMRGDNQFDKEYGITTSNVIGVVSSVIRNGKRIESGTSQFVLWVFYSRIYVCSVAVLRKIRRIFRRILCTSRKK